MGGSSSKISTVRSGDGPAFSTGAPIPGLLLAWAPAGASPTDRARIGDGITVGRSSGATWTISDERLSGTHLRVRPFGSTFLVEDLASTNGTFAGAERVGDPRPVGPGEVVRAGRCVFVVEADLGRLEAPAAPPPDIVGRFHAPALVHALDVAAQTERHLLLAGESGTGKELCTKHLHRALRPGSPFVAHNCARFASVEEAETTLYGVGRGVFSGVEARAGLLEDAEGGLLFLDELHVLPLRVQQSLLRFVEDGLHARIGAQGPRPLTVRLVFGTNAADGSTEIADDLVARLRVVRVPPLSERRADVPEIFRSALDRSARAQGVAMDTIAPSLTADHAEALCLADFSARNVRALEGIADEIAARVRRGEDPTAAVRRVFGDRLGDSPVARRGESDPDDSSHYDKNRERIVEAFHASRGNLSETERTLKAEGLRVSRRWLAEFLRKWGVRAAR